MDETIKRLIIGFMLLSVCFGILFIVVQFILLITIQYLNEPSINITSTNIILIFSTSIFAVVVLLCTIFKLSFK